MNEKVLYFKLLCILRDFWMFQTNSCKKLSPLIEVFFKFFNFTISKFQPNEKNHYSISHFF